MKTDALQILQELSEFLQQYYNGSFSRMACDYLHATGMTQEEVEELLEAMKKVVSGSKGEKAKEDFFQ